MKESKNTTKDFKFKQFSVHGGQSGMPVSTDGVLLGAWSGIDGAETLLDIGTGTGLLSLMCLQRNPRLSVVAVDIEQNAYQAAKQNAEQSPWRHNIEVLHTDVLSHRFERTFSHIICNPPYFNSGEQAESKARATARHTDTLNHHDLLKRCQTLLQPNGRASFILPTFEGEQMLQFAEQSGWYISRKCIVKPSIKKAAHRLLFELSLHPIECNVSELTIHTPQGYSDEFISLTKDFYLKM
ncbi:tRNA1(Val) (adenine(37)-N6)-methyltransferase [Vibrio paucivorans]|uniref:tRNA1(Val) (adenine(37)-N6)-methyltransferase n=1 Tax=Vibrio paucivorans TaxID=2829489 RepID=A0A9X3CFC1_9VIBR|nr:methyltransferase [Vibrio paucivorans]MCW8334681.1 tRNA (adenine(22)-N(1))-methyltransferase TrmK [Vibrio paucivorans]